MSSNFFSNPPLPQKFQNFVIPSNSSKHYADIKNAKENSVSELVPHPQPLIIDEDIEYTPVEITIPEEPRDTDEEEILLMNESPDQPAPKQDEPFMLDYTPGQDDPTFIHTDEDRIWNNEQHD